MVGLAATSEASRTTWRRPFFVLAAFAVALGAFGLAPPAVALATAGAGQAPLATAGGQPSPTAAGGQPPSSSAGSQPPSASAPVLGVNADLTTYDETGLSEILDIIADGGIESVRLPVRWSEVEPVAGDRDWRALDGAVNGLVARGMLPVLAVQTAPAWARRDPTPEPHLWLCEDDKVTGPDVTVHAPPTDAADLAAFVAAVVGRYRGKLWAVEVWPEPNLLPNWRATGPDPEEYGAVLAAVTTAVREVDDGVLVVSGALAPTTDVGVCYLSDVVFADRLARTGALDAVDAVAIEPFGLRDGPMPGAGDRESLDFSRPTVLHGVLERHGISAPLWAAAWGWVGLPPDWSGDASPWGGHDLETAATWTAQGYARARAEWPWMGAMFVWHMQPRVPATDPEWGFALVGPGGNVTLTWDAVRNLAAGQVPDWPPAAETGAEPGVAAASAVAGSTAFAGRLGGNRIAVIAAVVAALALAGAAAAWLARDTLAPARRAIAPTLRAVRRRGPAQLAAAFGVAAVAAAVGPWPVSLVAVPLMIVVGAAEPRLTYAAVAAAVPFYYRATMFLGPRPFGAVEALLFVAVAAAALRAMSEPADAAAGARRTLRSMRPLDWAAVVLVVWAALTPLWAENAAPAVREWRTVIAEPVVYYFLLRLAQDRRAAAQAALDGLMAGGAVAAVWALVGLALAAAGSGSAAVAAEGVLRANGPYSSPNNLALLLGRLTPVLAAFGLWGGGRRRTAYLAFGVPIALALMATFSRSAFVIGLPVTAAYLVAVAVHVSGRLTARPFLLAGAAAAAAAAALLPFAGTTRVKGTFSVEPGSTLFIRLRLWESALQMARDHPLLGVGLDNFLYLYGDRYVQRDAVQERFLSHPHNAVLDWWTRLGLPGLVLFVAVGAGNLLAGAKAIARACDSRGPAALARGPAWSPWLPLAVGALGMQVYALAHGMVDNVFFLVDLAVVWWIGQAGVLAVLDED